MERSLTIWMVLFLIAGLFLIVWTAVFLLVLRDKVLGYPHPAPIWDEEEIVAKPTPVPRWRRWLLVPFAILAYPLLVVPFLVIGAPVLFLLFLVIGVPFIAWNAAIDFFYRLRFRATGKPIPPFELLPEDFADPLQDIPGRC